MDSREKTYEDKRVKDGKTERWGGAQGIAALGGAIPYVSVTDLNKKTGKPDPSDPVVPAIEVGFKWTF